MPKSELSIEEFGDRMIAYMPKLSKEICRNESHYLKSGAVTVPQVWALEYISHQKDCQMKDLAGCMCIKFSATTGLVDRLVKQGLVKRIRSERDRRAVYIGVTDKGQKIIADVYKQKRKGLVELFKRLSAQERFAYIKLVERSLCRIFHRHRSNIKEGNSMNRVKVLIVNVLMAGFVLTFLGCDKKTPGGHEGGMMAVNVVAYTSQSQSISDQISLVGTLQANESVEIKSEMDGVIEEINFEEGHTVKKGQILFKIDEKKLKASLAQSEANLKLAQATTERYKALIESKFPVRNMMKRSQCLKPISPRFN